MTSWIRASAIARALALGTLALLTQGALASYASADTFQADSASLGAIPDGSGDLDVKFDVSGITDGSVNDATLVLGIDHPAVGELSVKLTAPDGTARTIFSGTGGLPTDTSDLSGRYAFSDDAPASPNWWSAADIASGDDVILPDSYRPTLPAGNPMQGQNTTMNFSTVADANGEWTLEVKDSAAGNAGTVSSAFLTLRPDAEGADTSSLGPIPDGTSTGVEHYGSPRDVTFAFSGLPKAAPQDISVALTFDPPHGYAGDVDVSLIAPDGTTQATIFSRTGATSAAAPGSSADLAGPYRFGDTSQSATSWWSAAAATGANAPIPAAGYRISQPGGSGAGGTPALLTPKFAGIDNPNGTWTLRVRDGSASDTGGVSAASMRILPGTDPVAPQAPTLSGTTPASPSSSNSPGVTGTSEAGSRVRLFPNASCLGVPVAVGDSLGRFSVPLTLPSDTTTTISAAAYDSSGNVSGCSNSISYSEDSTPPAKPTLASLASPANDNLPRFQGNAEADSTVSIYTNQGAPSCSGLPAETGTAATFNGAGVPVLVPDDVTYNVTVSTKDAAGNVSPCSDPIVYTEDSSVQPPNITGSLPDVIANENKPTIFGNAESDVVTIELYKRACSGAPVTTGTAAKFGSPGLKISVPDDSKTSLLAIAVDQAGNRSACSDEFSYIEDSKPPKTTIDSKPKPVVSTKAGKARFKITFESSQPHPSSARTPAFECKLDRGRFKTCQSAVKGKVKPGRHTFQVAAIDYAGNVDKTPAKASWKVKPKRE